MTTKQAGNVIPFSLRSASEVAKKRKREGAWRPLASRGISTMVDTWTEYLCVRPARTPGYFQLAVCGTFRGGRLRPMQDDSSREVGGRAPAILAETLRALDWPPEDLSTVQQALADLIDAWPQRAGT
jgi:hypothetical protein